MLASGALMLPCSGLTVLGRAHAFALMFYGMRLNLFLLYRELSLPVEVHQMKARDATLAERFKRAPVILGCSLLYFCMAAPLRLTALSTPDPAASAAIALAFFGFAVAALGDAWKTVVKSRKGGDFLVTTGPFRWLRHPNYTGECFGWTASFAAACLIAAARGMAFSRRMTPWLLASALGWVGILFVLAGEATGGLEKKQRDKYAGSARHGDKYAAWLKGSWSGPMINLPAPESSEATAEEAEAFAYMSVPAACRFMEANPSVPFADKKAFLLTKGVSEFVIAEAACTAPDASLVL